MSTQPEALRLADALERDIYRVVGEKPTQDAAAELRRLHKENERLTGALKKANDQAEHFEREWYLRGDAIEELQEANKQLAQSRHPLSDGWILGMWPDTGFPHLVLKFARAIEASHGIKEEA